MCFPQGLEKVEVHMDHLLLSTMPPCHSSMLFYTRQLFLAHYTLRGVVFALPPQPKGCRPQNSTALSPLLLLFLLGASEPHLLVLVLALALNDQTSPQPLRAPSAAALTFSPSPRARRRNFVPAIDPKIPLKTTYGGPKLPPPRGVDFVLVPMPVDSFAAQGDQPSSSSSSSSLRVLELQPSAPLPAPAPADLGAQQGGQPSAQLLCAPEPQPCAPIPALAPVDSGAPQGGQPSAQALRAREP